MRLISDIRTQLAEMADPTLAPAMQAYMKSEMPYLGVRVPMVRAIVRQAELARPPVDLEMMTATSAQLWREATHREQRYAATALLDTRRAQRLMDPRAVPLLQEMIVTGAWWDHVDEVAHRVSDLLLAYRPKLDPVIRAWAQAEDRWLRRAAVISQLGARASTDTDLLSHTIAANAADPDFFLRKAIGWALREYARTDPEWVRAFVTEHATELSPLSKREALKHV